MGNKIYTSDTAIAHEIEHVEEPVHPKNSACSVKVDVATPNKHDSKSEANLQANRDIALTRMRMGSNTELNHAGMSATGRRSWHLNQEFLLKHIRLYRIPSRWLVSKALKI